MSGADTGERVAVLDLGKTNIKVLVADENGAPVEALSFPNAPDASGPYLAIDLPRIEALVIDALAELGKRHNIRAIVGTAHGCGGVLVDDHRPVLPAMDYEATPPDWLHDAYLDVGPTYGEVFCSLSGGAMRPAQGLLWQEREFPREFQRAKHFLLTPQYFAFRLGGRPVTEISSLAAQCHLWNPLKSAFSSIVQKKNWQRLFPAFARAGEVVGHLSPELAKRTGLAPDVEILAGAHDSNANFYRYKAAGLADYTVLSTGTWMIGFNRGRPLEDFREERAMVANVDVDGEPIASTLTMTGREYQILAGDPPISDERAFNEVERLIARGTIPIPSFVEDPGPVPNSGGKGRIIGPLPQNSEERGANAALYAAYVADLCLDVLGSTTPIVIDGGFATNATFALILAGLRASQDVYVSRSKDGTALGAGLLWRRFDRTRPVTSVELKKVEHRAISGLHESAKSWRGLVN